MLKNHLLIRTNFMLSEPTNQSKNVVQSYHCYKWSNQMLIEVKMENYSPSCQMTNHQNSNEYVKTQELWKPVNREAARKTRFPIFLALSEWNKTKNWSAFGSMLASRKFLDSPQRLSNFKHRIKPMNTKIFEMKDKQTEICGIKDAESYDFVLIDHWKMANTLPFRFSKTNNNL